MASEHWTDKLSAYLDDELAPAEREVAEAHFAKCQACRELRDDLIALQQAARLTPAPPAATDPWPRIATRIRTPEPRPRTAWRWLAAALVPAAIAVVVWMRPPAAPSSPTEALRDEAAALERQFDAIEGRLDPRTAGAIRQSLTALDAALDRAASEAGTGASTALLDDLASRAWTQKLELLRSATSADSGPRRPS
jgi:anti-sigma factor RsiW